jgi:hypothetical protein
MKNFIFVLCSFLLFSCSGDDDKGNNSQSSINPPDWIQGTWLYNQVGFRFTSDDFCALQNNIASCNKEILKQTSDAGAYTNVEEVKTDSEYKLTMTFSSQSVTYHFYKVSNNKIRWTAIDNVEYTKQ